MLKNVRKFFNDKLDPTSAGNAVNQMALATAALMFEVMRADTEITVDERHATISLLMDMFELSPEDLKAIAELAEAEVNNANDLFQFTSLVNDNYSESQRVDLIRNMWRVAFADGKLDHYEEHIIRKVADLLHVRHANFIRAKLEARDG